MPEFSRAGREQPASLVSGGLPGTHKRISDTPLETQKKGVVDTLLSMNRNMKDFSADIESRLERAYDAVGGASRKYGFEPATGKELERMVDPSTAAPSREQRQTNHRLNRI